MKLWSAVFHCAKLQFWKQITTRWRLWLRHPWLYFTALNYNFESKSQLTTVVEMAANAVFHCAKLQFWKQITTARSVSARTQTLYFTALNYNFESKSQRIGCDRSAGLAVFHCAKLQFWKQITTDAKGSVVFAELYFTALNYNFESKSQLGEQPQMLWSGCISLR